MRLHLGRRPARQREPDAALARRIASDLVRDRRRTSSTTRWSSRASGSSTSSGAPTRSGTTSSISCCTPSAPSCSGACCWRWGCPAPGSRRRSSRCTRCTWSRWPGSASGRTSCRARSTWHRRSPIFATPGAAERGEPRSRSLYAASLALFLCALLAKTVTCTLPAALLLALWWKHGCVARRDVLALLPFFALGIGLGLTTVWLERHEVGAAGAEWDLSFSSAA